MTTRIPKTLDIDKTLRSHVESIAHAAHTAVYLVSFIGRRRYSARLASTMRVDVQVNAKLGGRRAQIWLGNFATLTEMSDADLAHLVVAKIAQKEAKLLCSKEN